MSWMQVWEDDEDEESKIKWTGFLEDIVLPSLKA